MKSTVTILILIMTLGPALHAGNAQPSAQRLAEVGPRFAQPSDDPACVMPVGAGDLSAMLRYGNALEIHLSKTDFFGWDHAAYHKNPTLLSPGHVRLSFGIPQAAIRSFAQRLDFQRGSVRLEIRTDDGTVNAEAFGSMGRNTLVVAVEDGRRTPAAGAEFSLWRPEMSVGVAGGRIVARQVHDYCENGQPPADSAPVNAADRMFHLGCGTTVAFADERGILPAEGDLTGSGTNRLATLRPGKPVARYWLVIAGATTYDGHPEAVAAALLEAAARADKARLLDEHLDWWARLWQAAFIDLRGSDADTLMRLWYAGQYSYASVAGGPVLPKFNGGPGLINRDERSWGWGLWWQNTREMVWPLFAGNRLICARAALDFYDGTFQEWKQSTARNGKLGLRMTEWVAPNKPGLPTPAKTVSTFDPAALGQAITDLTMENVKSGYNARSLAQAAELTQLMFDYVAFTGDTGYLNTTVAPWLKEAALFYLSYLRPGEDGLYHSMVSDAAEMWWKIKDPAIDLSAARYLFWRVLNHGAEFGYEPDFIAAVRERAGHLAPLPLGQWNRRAVTLPGQTNVTTKLVLDRNANLFAPFGDIYDDQNPHNQENPELYLIYPFAMVDGNSPKPELERAVNTFRQRRFPNSVGWSQCPVQAARLRLEDAVDVIADHAQRHAKYPYGGWTSPAGKLKGSKTGATDTPYFDSMGVNLTALQETLLQSHHLTSSEKDDALGGGPIVLVPAARPQWSGRFKLRARGGFLVTAEFETGRRVTQATIECERGGPLRVVNPFGECRVAPSGKPAGSTTEPLIVMDTRAGEVIEFSWKSAPRGEP